MTHPEPVRVQGSESGSPSAGVCPVDRPDEGPVTHVKADLGEHLLQEPAIGAELASDVFGQFASSEPSRWVRDSPIHPGFDSLVCRRRVEIEDQVANAGGPAGPEHRRHSLQCRDLPEVRELVERIAGKDHVRKVARMFIGEESCLDDPDVCDATFV